MFTQLFALLFQSNDILSPTMIAVVTAIITLVLGTVGVAYLKDKVNASSRIRGLLAALIAAYGIIAPVISNVPRSVGVTIAIVGLAVKLFSGAIQGRPDDPV